MQKHFSITILFLLVTGWSFAQQAQIDSLQLLLKQDSAHIYRFRKLMPLLSLDQRNTFLETSASSNTPVNFRGIKLGATVFERHKTGIGAYTINNSKTHISRVNGQSVDLNFTFNYFTVFYEYYFIHTKWWDVGVPFEAGIGKYKAIDTVFSKTGTVFPLGTAIDVHFKPIRWLSFNTMGGYRVVGKNNSGVKLSNWFYSFGISVSTRHVYEDARYYLKKRKFRRAVKRLLFYTDDKI